jgi:hypothetical protein
VEHAIFDTESRAGTQLLLHFRNSPGALTFGGRRVLLTTTRCDERVLSIDEFDDLSNDRIIASTSGKCAVRSARVQLSLSHQSRAHNCLSAVKYI